jgi:hypothetical protein
MSEERGLRFLTGASGVWRGREEGDGGSGKGIRAWEEEEVEVLGLEEK